MQKKLINIIESILFVAGSEVEISEIADKLNVTKDEMKSAIAELKEKYSGDCGINVLEFNKKLQLATNPNYVEEVSSVLNPIRERELTNAMLETLAIIAYKQPITRTEIEEVRGVDCTYALQNLSKMSMVKILGRKDAIGKPLLFGTTDEFLKRFSLTSLDELPDYDTLLSRIHTLSTGIDTDLYNSNRDKSFKAEEEIPDFIAGEKFDIIE